MKFPFCLGKKGIRRVCLNLRRIRRVMLSELRRFCQMIVEISETFSIIMSKLHVFYNSCSVLDCNGLLTAYVVELCRNCQMEVWIFELKWLNVNEDESYKKPISWPSRTSVVNLGSHLDTVKNKLRTKVELVWIGIMQVVVMDGTTAVII
jgi:hypothetical protein